MQVSVNTVTDFSFGFLAHNLQVPPQPAPAPVFSIEMVAPFMWIYGFAMNQNKFSNGAKPVFCKGTWVVLDGHDCGMMVPDITTPPAPNIWPPLYWLFSSRKPVMSASTVKMNGTAVAAAQLIGLPAPVIMLRHVLPNAMGPILVIATINLALAVITEATLSFLGAGMPDTMPSLGTLIRIGNNYLFAGEWWIVAFPGLALASLILAINLLGDWLRDALNPKLR